MTSVHRDVARSAAFLGLMAALVGGRAVLPKRWDRVQTPPGYGITPIELATWIKDRKPGLRIIDVRPSQDFSVFQLPHAQSAPLEGATPLIANATDTLVFYADGDLSAAPVLLLAPNPVAGSVRVLRGGMEWWIRDVMNPVLLAGASNDEKAAFKRDAELSRYFGGLPRILDVTESAAFRRTKPTPVDMRRRGC